MGAPRAQGAADSWGFTEFSDLFPDDQTGSTGSGCDPRGPLALLPTASSLSGGGVWPSDADHVPGYGE